MTLRLSTGLATGLLDTGSFRSLMGGAAGFQIDIYTGTRPTTPDAAATGTKLASITVGAGKLHLAATADNAVILKDAGEAWAGTGLADGTAGYFRAITGADNGSTVSTTAMRVDGVIATSGGDMNMTSTTVATGAPIAASAASFTLPTA